MIAGETRNDLGPLGLPFCQGILTGKLDAAFDGFGPAGDKEYPFKIARCAFGKAECQIFGRVIFKMQTIGKAGLFKLRIHSSNHARVAMADIADHRTAGGVDIAFAIDIPHIDAFGMVDQRPTGTALIKQAGFPVMAGFGVIMRHFGWHSISGQS